MAERRMFAKTIIDSDAFLDMPLSSQALYFHLSMRADDDGFINNPRKIQRMIGASDDDLRLLDLKNFIIPFESGIVVIKHWKIHNYIQADRYKPTVYTEEKAQLEIKGNKAYTLTEPEFEPMDTPCIQDVSSADTQVRLGKDRLGKDRLDQATEAPPAQPGPPATPPPVLNGPPLISLQLNDGTLYPIYQKDVDAWGQAYPAVDVMGQLRSMWAWLDANPKNRKTKGGIRRFINNWLSKEQNRAPRQPATPARGGYSRPDPRVGNYEYNPGSLEGSL